MCTLSPINLNPFRVEGFDLRAAPLGSVSLSEGDQCRLMAVLDQVLLRVPIYFNRRNWGTRRPAGEVTPDTAVSAPRGKRRELDVR